jgi:hypothetical protein
MKKGGTAKKFINLFAPLTHRKMWSLMRGGKVFYMQFLVNNEKIKGKISLLKEERI